MNNEYVSGVSLLLRFIGREKILIQKRGNQINIFTFHQDKIGNSM